MTIGGGLLDTFLRDSELLDENRSIIGWGNKELEDIDSRRGERFNQNLGGERISFVIFEIYPKYIGAICKADQCCSSTLVPCNSL